MDYDKEGKACASLPGNIDTGMSSTSTKVESKSPNPENHMCCGAGRVFPALRNSPLLFLLERGSWRHRRTPPHPRPLHLSMDLTSGWTAQTSLQVALCSSNFFPNSFLWPPSGKTSPHHSERGEVACSSILGKNPVLQPKRVFCRW